MDSHEAESISGLISAVEEPNSVELRHQFLGKSHTVKIIIHSNNTAEPAPPYYLSLTRGSYLHLYLSEVKRLLNDFCSFGTLSEAKLQYKDTDLPLELPFGVLRDVYLADEPIPCMVLRCFSQGQEPVTNYIDHFKQSLKEAAFVKTSSGDAFRQFSGPKTWRSMFESLQAADYTCLDSAQKGLTDRFDGDSCPVRVLWKGKECISGRRALRNETLEEFLRRSYPLLDQKCQQMPLSNSIKVLCGGVELPLTLRVGSVDETLRFGDLFVYLILTNR